MEEPRRPAQVQRAKPTDHLTCGRLGGTPGHYAPIVGKPVTNFRMPPTRRSADARLQHAGRLYYPPSADLSGLRALNKCR
jgi:hypothetical protein